MAIRVQVSVDNHGAKITFKDGEGVEVREALILPPYGSTSFEAEDETVEIVAGASF